MTWPRGALFGCSAMTFVHVIRDYVSVASYPESGPECIDSKLRPRRVPVAGLAEAADLVAAAKQCRAKISKYEAERWLRPHHQKP